MENLEAASARSIARPKVLCVDDEPQVLQGLSLHLRRRYDVVLATSGQYALGQMPHAVSPAVIISDMRMPEMDGATFLAKARAVVPDAVRMLLTGYADMDSAIAAVNDGQIFRFLIKPCPPPTLLAAVDAAVEQHRLVQSERVLLEETLQGSVQALTDALAITHPISFGRATRVKRLVSGMAEALRLGERWQVEIAAMLSQLGSIALPHETAEKLHLGEALSEREQAMVTRMPEVTEQLLAHIPRLETVRAILAAHAQPPARRSVRPADREAEVIERGANLLRVAVDYDGLAMQGHAPSSALDVLGAHVARYEPVLLEVLAAVVADDSDRSDVREVTIRALRPGMVLVEDVKTPAGMLIAAHGYEIRASFIARLQNYRPGTVKEPLLVRMSGARATS